MTKTTLLSFLLSLSVFLLYPSSVYAVTLTGDWLSGELKLKAEQSGDNFSLIIVDTRVPKKFQGIAELKGTISGHTFTGEEFTYHPECPNLDGYRAASGNVTNTKIEIIGIFFRYDTDACTLDAGTETEITGTYTKVLSPEEQALQDYQDELARFDEDLANRSGPVIDNSSAIVVSASPVAKSEKYSIKVSLSVL